MLKRLSLHTYDKTGIRDCLLMIAVVSLTTIIWSVIISRSAVNRRIHGSAASVTSRTVGAGKAAGSAKNQTNSRDNLLT